MIYYNIRYFNLKSNEEDEPSAETLSVVPLLDLLRPPRSRTSPEGSPQQRCPYLASTSLTPSDLKPEVPSNFSQDLSAAGALPPHNMLRHIVWNFLDCFRSSIELALFSLG